MNRKIYKRSFLIVIIDEKRGLAASDLGFSHQFLMELKRDSKMTPQPIVYNKCPDTTSGIPDITLKLKPAATYRITPLGVFFFTEHGFRVFVPNALLNEIMRFKHEMCKM